MENYLPGDIFGNASTQTTVVFTYSVLKMVLVKELQDVQPKPYCAQT